MKDDLFNYLVATDTLDEFLGNETINVYQCVEGKYIKMKVIGKYKYLGGLDQIDLVKNNVYVFVNQTENEETVLEVNYFTNLSSLRYEYYNLFIVHHLRFLPLQNLLLFP